MLFLILLNVHAQKSAVFLTNGKAIKGFDAVAFFTELKPVKGQDSLSYSWNGADWLFSTRQHLNLFKAQPEKYAPQYGGYCAYGTSQGHKAPTEVETWSVLDGKLYFNYSSKVKEMWSKDKAGYIKKADDQWPSIKDKE
jgi:YHS domain-containing protein